MVAALPGILYKKHIKVQKSTLHKSSLWTKTKN